MNQKIDMDKENKYDRQIRLWGEIGQQKISSSKIMLIGADPAGVEALKNLVLPGVQKICIIDNKNMSDVDLNNFFINQYKYDETKLRGQEILDNLLEMNPTDVKGEFQTSYNDDLINQYDVIICNEQKMDEAFQISQICEKLQKKFISIQTNGMIGLIVIAAQIHPCNFLLSKDFSQQKKIKDLRILQPFNLLQKYFDSFDIDELFQNPTEQNAQKLRNIPFPVILHKKINLWLKNNQNKLPKSFSEIKQFQKTIKEGLNVFDNDQIQIYFNNYDEAAQNYDQALQANNTINDSVQKVFNNEYCQNATQGCNQFWILSKALYIFYQKNQRIPQTNNVPDMDTSTENYIEIKKIYLNQHNFDFEEFKNIVINIDNTIKDNYILFFLNNAIQLDYQEYKTYKQIIQDTNQRKQQDHYDENINLPWIDAINAKDIFFKINNRLTNQNDLQEYLEIINQQQKLIISDEDDIQIEFQSEIAQEMLQNTKIHSIAAIIGGIVAQECIKLCQDQQQPLNNTFIYNGIHGTGSAFQF